MNTTNTRPFPFTFNRLTCALSLTLSVFTLHPYAVAANQQAQSNEQSSVNYRQQNDQQEEVITIIGKMQTGQYRHDFADSATKTLTDNLSIPQPVDVITQSLIESQAALDLQQVFRNTASVNAVDPLGHTNIRGFRLNENSGGILKNGLRDVSQGFAFQPLANIEKIEVIKGASSALYGRGEPGGLINLITKKPQNEAFVDTSMTLGNDAFYQVNLDANGEPLADGKLTYRLNVQINDEQSFRDVVYRKRTFIAPVVSYQINNEQKVTFEAEYNQFEQTRDFGIARINGDLEAMPINAFVNADTQIDTTITTFEVAHQWYVGQNWLLNSKFRVGQDDSNDALFNPLPEAFQQGLNNADFWLDETPRIYRTNTSADDEKKEWNLDVNLAADATLAGFDHGVLFGVNINRREQQRTSFLHTNRTLYATLATVNPQLAGYALTSQVSAFDPQDPMAINLPTALAAHPLIDARHEMSDAVTLGDGQTTIKSTGIYVQDQVQFNQHWQMLVSVRYDDFDTEQTQQNLNTLGAFGGLLFTPDGSVNPLLQVTSAQNHNDSAISPRLGIIYSPTDNIALYLSQARQFNIQMGVDAQGTPFKPQRSNATETGVKWEMDDKLSVNLAYFNIEKTNLLTQDIDNPLFSRQLGELTSKGFEVSVLGQLNDNWVISANYADFDATISKDPAQPQNVGNRERGTADSSGAIWLQYQSEPQAMSGWTFAIGANHVGKRPGDDANSFELPAFTLIDASASYQFSNDLTLRLQVENLTDKNWYQGAYHSYSIYPGHGAKARLSVDYRL